MHLLSRTIALALPHILSIATAGTVHASDSVRCWRWEQLKPRELAEAVATVPIAYLVVSPLEWHGEAMAFATDPAIGMAIAEKAWRKTGGVLIPTLYLGAETEYKDWGDKGLEEFWGLEWNARERLPGSLYVRPTTLELVLRETLWCIEREGFLTCVIVSGHGATEHVRVLRDIEERYAKRPMRVVYSNMPQRKRPDDLRFEGSGGHADFAEASNLGGVDSSMVDKSKFGVAERDRKIKLLSENVGKIDYEKGARNIEFRSESVAQAALESLGPPITRPIPAEKGFRKRIDCGSIRGVQDSRGYVWEGDWKYGGTGARADRGDIAIAATAVPEIYRTEAYSVGTYTVPVPPGSYQVVLHFAETYEGVKATGQRLVDITLNGKTVAADIDVFRESGMKRNTAVVRTFETTAPDGVVAVTFGSKTGNAIVNAIEIVAKSR